MIAILEPITDNGNHLQDLIDNNPSLYHCEQTFSSACRDLGYGRYADQWSANLTPLSTVEEFISAVPEELREQFLKLYIYHFNRQLVT